MALERPGGLAVAAHLGVFFDVGNRPQRPRSEMHFPVCVRTRKAARTVVVEIIERIFVRNPFQRRNQLEVIARAVVHIDQPLGDVVGATTLQTFFQCHDRRQFVLQYSGVHTLFGASLRVHYDTPIAADGAKPDGALRCFGRQSFVAQCRQKYLSWGTRAQETHCRSFW